MTTVPSTLDELERLLAAYQRFPAGKRLTAGEALEYKAAWADLSHAAVNALPALIAAKRELRVPHRVRPSADPYRTALAALVAALDKPDTVQRYEYLTDLAAARRLIEEGS